MAKATGFAYKDSWYLQLASQEGVHKVEPIFIFEK